MAVLVRPSKSESARQRVENLLRHWELMLETTLPRPVVLEGDLSESDLGLDNRTLDWIERHCKAVVHNAASLVFRGDDPDGDLPFQRGRHAADPGTLPLHRHPAVPPCSTAYVCGLRKGRILESDVDVGQTAGNVYEKTKLQAEMLVRSAASASRPAHDLPPFDHRRRFADGLHDDLSRVLRPAEACPHDGQPGRGGRRRAICSWRPWGSRSTTARISCRSIGSRP